jgi:RNA polymerase subunit RPABC4/transcription elongation factor Spt4
MAAMSDEDHCQHCGYPLPTEPTCPNCRSPIDAAQWLSSVVEAVVVPTDLEKKYYELVYAVASKYPGESRHQTALRYIMEREQSSRGQHPEAAKAAETK